MLTSGTCLVTGGAGFIGCAISQGLLRRFERVVVVDNLHPQVHRVQERPRALAEGAVLIVGDVTEPSTWSQVLSHCRPTTILHLAAETGTGQSLTEAARYARVNVLGTAVMLDALAQHQCIPEHMVLTSSRAVYGEGPWRTRQTGEVVYPGQRSREQLAKSEWNFSNLEPLPANASATRALPVSIYGATKLAQENLIASWANAFGIATTVVRLQNVYGPGQSLSNPYTGIVPLFCQFARRNQSIPLYEDGQMLRDFVLIDDVASAILATLANPRGFRGPYDVGSGVAISIADLATEIARRYGAPSPHVCGEYRFGDVRHACCEIGPTKNALLWQPQNRISNGLPKLVEWIEDELAREAQ